MWCDYKKLQKGFTVVEVLVSVAIVVAILAIVVFNQGDFNDQFGLTTNVSDVELQLRQAQVYGVSVREFVPSGGEFTAAYGVSMNLTSQGISNGYLFFADRGTKNGAYDGSSTCLTGGANECIARFTFSRGVTLSQVCVIQSNGSESCTPNVSRVDVSFLRPDPSARITFFNSSNGQVVYPGHRGARIELASPRGKTRSVVIFTTGQISIQ